MYLVILYSSATIQNFLLRIDGIGYALVTKYCSILTDHMWEIPVANVRISARLGRGAYGGLFDAEITLPNGQFARALVKVLNFDFT